MTTPWYTGIGAGGMFLFPLLARFCRSCWSGLRHGRTGLFLTGFIQVALIAVNQWFVSKGAITAATVVGFGISLTWTWNVKKVAFGNNWDRIIYSTGAAVGTLSGLLIARSFIP